MATFPSTPEPSYSLTKRSKPNIRTIKFADGFEKRITFGLSTNQNPKIYSLLWKNITELESDQIESFLDSRVVDGESFTYTPPNEGFIKTGTYSQSSTVVTITISNHGLVVGNTVTIDYTSGSAVDGTFVVATTANLNVFTVNAAIGATNTGNVSVSLSGAKQFKCDEWTKTMNYGNLADIKATFIQVFEP
tara:strand:- start:10977 stop:11549 length:573 start_codon:yes stop_codon:yes gene_type:complete